MRRNFVLSLSLLATLAGCGEAERPRFVPASPDAPRSTAVAGRRPAGEASREVVVPKNIPMH